MATATKRVRTQRPLAGETLLLRFKTSRAVASVSEIRRAGRVAVATGNVAEAHIPRCANGEALRYCITGVA